MQPQHITTRYTQIPIIDPSHQTKIQAYMSQPAQPKTSFCRFYLRGLCIMKPEYCKFAHKFEQIDLSEDEYELIKTSSYDQKERKKLYFQAKQDFQQKPLFIIKNIDYLILYQYQFEQKWKQSSKFKKAHTIEEIKEDRQLRHKIREVLHQQNWSKLIDYLIQKFPRVDFSISFLSKWFSKVGFQKPQTRCKFGDFMRYMVAVKQFKQVNIMMPPRLEKTVFFVNCGQNGRNTHLFQNIVEIQEIHFKAKQEYKKEMMIRLQPLAQELRKKFMCRYFMAGNCEYTEDECKYAHCISELKFEVNQIFQLRHKQLAKNRQERLNYVSLYKYAVNKINKEITLEQLNGNCNLRQQYRRVMHHELYSDFLHKLQELNGEKNLRKGFIEQQYNGAGFNHSEENKFGQFQSSLFDIGYVVEDIKLQGEKGPKSTYVYRIPPIQQLDQYFTKHINIILEEQVSAIKKAQLITGKSQNSINQFPDQIKQLQTDCYLPQLSQNSSSQHQPRQVILQSSFRKKLYHIQIPFTVPLHVYLRLKSFTLEQAIKQLTSDKSLLEHVFFQTSQQNYKKLIDLCKQYFKNSKQYIHKLDSIEVFIKSLHQDQINLNTNVTLKSFLQPALIESGKKVYSLKFGSNTFVIDRGHLPGHQKTVIKGKYLLKDYRTNDQTVLSNLNQNPLSKERIVIVDNQSAYDYAQVFLSNCNKMGVDLEGRLKKDGYIDLIQVSSVLNKKKQIFVFDVFVVKKLENQSLYEKIAEFLKLIFQDPFRVKIMHDCKQDSTALKYLMGIELTNVFDTSGMHMILQQKQVYEKWQKKNQTAHHILKKTLQVKVPGLNTVLQKWGAPNGVNIFKESMKKRFHEDGPRSYFQQRPIDLEFLQYSAQDVEDLIEVYEAMKKEDTDRLSQVVGEIYSTAHISNQ